MPEIFALGARYGRDLLAHEHRAVTALAARIRSGELPWLDSDEVRAWTALANRPDRPPDPAPAASPAAEPTKELDD